MVIISRGAEAEIHLEKGVVVKKRIVKKYRLPEIDSRLRRSRTRSEAKIVQKLSGRLPVPEIIKCDDEDIWMSYIRGEKVRDILEGRLAVCSRIGEGIAEIHNAGIIHGDLTTSNMLLENNEVYFIDFGLSFFSHRAEDRAVDLHLLKQALDSRHYKVSRKAFKAVLAGYRMVSKDYPDVFKRLEIVERRGRNKGKA